MAIVHAYGHSICAKLYYMYTSIVHVYAIEHVNFHSNSLLNCFSNNNDCAYALVLLHDCFSIFFVRQKTNKKLREQDTNKNKFCKSDKPEKPENLSCR